MTDKQRIARAVRLYKAANSAWAKHDKICEQLWPEKKARAKQVATKADSNLFGYLRDMGQTFSEELPFWDDLCLDWDDLGDYD